MGSITIRDLDPALEERLRTRAARHGRTMEAEILSILRGTLPGQPSRPPGTLVERVRARAEAVGGFDDIEIPPRLPDRSPPAFD